ncbi:MAG: flagellar basal-body rod protein FlgG [Gammaproteobacteria bacterium]|nr:flagellar basal-body rod protein FlgG [Gammaproteobacteria bacterium]
MNRALAVAKTGLDGQQMRLAVISNNLANVNTTGFKKGQANFADLLYQNIRQPGALSSQNSQLPSGLMLGTGVRVVSTDKLYAQGNLVQTEATLDLAIQGGGFFEILLPDGTTAYTRDGNFQSNSDGDIVTSEGFSLQPGITLPEDLLSLSISSDGIVSAVVAGNATPQVLGTLQLSEFTNPAGLQPLGNNLLVETAASGSPQTGAPGLDGRGLLIQGSLENSNVNVVEELVGMIETQRAYEMNSRAISTADEMLQFVTQNL